MTTRETMLDCRYNTVGSELVTRRLLRTSVAPGKHTVVIRVAEAGFVYFDFLEAAVLSDIPDALTPRTNISPALDFDTDQTYKVSPSRLLWMFQKLGYAGPMNEYLGVFWWNQRTPKAGTGSVSTVAVAFAGPFAGGDLVAIDFDGGGRTEENGISHRYAGHHRGALRGLHQLFAHRLVGIDHNRRRSHHHRTLARAAVQSGRNRHSYSRCTQPRPSRMSGRPPARTPLGMSTTPRARPSIGRSRTGTPISILNATRSASRS